MYLKLFVEDTDLSGPLPVIKIRNEPFILGIRRTLAKILKIPEYHLNLQFLNRTLEDYDLVRDVVVECQTFGASDITIRYAEQQFVCKMRFEEDPDDTMDMILACVTSLADECVSNGRQGRIIDHEERPPYASLRTDKRSFAVVIQRCSSSEYFDREGILGLLMDRLSKSKKPLKFDAIAPLVPFDQGILVVGDNADTRDWVLRISQDIYPPLRCEPFVRYFELERWCITIPVPTEPTMGGLNLVCHFLEYYNDSLDTAKWCVLSQTVVDKPHNEGAPYMELIISIDQKSAKLLTKKGFKVKYWFWTLEIHPCAN